MEFHLKLEKYHRKYGRMDRESFVLVHEHPVVVYEIGGVGAAVRDFDSYAATSTANEPTAYGPMEEDALERTLVALVAKSDRNQFRDKILLGRSPVSDIVVAHPSVSKMHAFFERDPEKGYRLFDGDSRYGTALNGQILDKGVGVPVKSRDALVLAGYVSLTFLAPGDFFEFMMMAAKRVKK